MTSPDPNRIVIHGSFTSSSSYKPILFLSLAQVPFSFRTVNLKNGVQKEPAHLAMCADPEGNEIMLTRARSH